MCPGACLEVRNNAVELVFSFQFYMVLRIKLRSPSLCNKYFYLLSHLNLNDFSKNLNQNLSYGIEKRLYLGFLLSFLFVLWVFFNVSFARLWSLSTWVFVISLKTSKFGLFYFLSVRNTCLREKAWNVLSKGVIPWAPISTFDLTCLVCTCFGC